MVPTTHRSTRFVIAIGALAALALPSLPAPPAHGAVCKRKLDPAPFASTPCEGVRPGGVLVNSTAPVVGEALPENAGDGHCTMGFLFRSGRDRFVSTAGHCSGVAEGTEQVWRPGEGQVVNDNRGRRIGEFAYAVADGRHGVYLDFGLVRLDPGVDASPEVCHFGGPTGVNRDIVPASKLVELPYYGAGVAVGYVPGAKQWTLPARTGFAQGLVGSRRVLFDGPAFEGDSGGPVLSSDGRAVGLISDVGDAGTDDGAGLTKAVRIGPQIDQAERALQRKLRLWVGRRA
jgi:hypothetical protein